MTCLKLEWERLVSFLTSMQILYFLYNIFSTVFLTPSLSGIHCRLRRLSGVKTLRSRTIMRDQYCQEPGKSLKIVSCWSLGIAALYHNSDWITDNLRKMARGLVHVHELVAINSSYLKNSGDYLISSSTFMMSFSRVNLTNMLSIVCMSYVCIFRILLIWFLWLLVRWELTAPRNTSYLQEAHLQSSNVILVFVILSVCLESDALAT